MPGFNYVSPHLISLTTLRNKCYYYYLPLHFITWKWPKALESRSRQCESKSLILKHEDMSLCYLMATPAPILQVIVHSFKKSLSAKVKPENKNFDFLNQQQNNFEEQTLNFLLSFTYNHFTTYLELYIRENLAHCHYKTNPVRPLCMVS